jgi:hypothetical protein
MSATEPASAASNPGVTPDPYELLTQTLADRGTLVRLCLYALDRARSDGVAERIERGLAGVGVLPVRPEGQPFDPARHEAAGAVPTDDPRLAGLVAATEVAGFTDHGRVLRAPVVTVYQQREP